MQKSKWFKWGWAGLIIAGLIALVVSYLWCMFIQPYLNGELLVTLKNWQTLNAGILAVIASAAAIGMSRKIAHDQMLKSEKHLEEQLQSNKKLFELQQQQEEQRRQQEFESYRARLPEVLSELNAQVERIFKEYEKLFFENKKIKELENIHDGLERENPVKLWGDLKLKDLENLPQFQMSIEAREIVQKCIELGPKDLSERLVSMMHIIQIGSARLHGSDGGSIGGSHYKYFIGAKSKFATLVRLNAEIKPYWDEVRQGVEIDMNLTEELKKQGIVMNLTGELVDFLDNLPTIDSPNQNQ